MVTKIRDAFGGSEAGKKLAILGLTFKPETDDMREAPALTILPKLLENGALVRAHDPQGMREAKSLLPDSIEYFDDIYDTIKGVDAVILLTEWNAYRGLDLEHIRGIMKGNVFLDLRNVYEREQMTKAGFDYYCVGR